MLWSPLSLPFFQLYQWQNFDYVCVAVTRELNHAFQLHLLSFPDSSGQGAVLIKTGDNRRLPSRHFG